MLSCILAEAAEAAGSLRRCSPAISSAKRLLGAEQGGDGELRGFPWIFHWFEWVVMVLVMVLPGL